MNRTLRALLLTALVALAGCDKPLLTESPSLGLAHPRAVAVTYNSADVPKALPDVQTTTSTLQASNSGYVTGATVQFNINHTNAKDLIVSLISPSGTIVILTSRHGTGANYTNTAFDDAATTAIAAGATPFTGTYTPEQPLNWFNGENAQGTWTLRVQDAIGGNSGTLTDWSLTLSTTDVAPTPAPGVLTTIAASAPEAPKALQDLGTVTSSIQVPDLGTVQSMRVQINLTHTFDMDLKISLTGPGGAVTRLLVNRRGAGGKNFTNTVLADVSPFTVALGTAPFTATYKPEESLSAFGASAEGTWTLSVQDVEGGDSGNLLGWSLQFRAIPPNALPTAVAGADFTVMRSSPAGAGVTLDAAGSSDSDGSITNYEWIESQSGISISSGAMAQQDVVLALGVHALTLRVTDDKGATSEDQQVITVENSPPMLEINGPFTVNCGPGGANVTFVATATDVDGTLTYAWSTGASTSSISVSAPLGTTNVSVTVTDNDGASAQASSSVTVSDTGEPTIYMTVNPTTLWAPNHTLVKVASGIAAADGCDDSPLLSVEVGTNEPSSGVEDDPKKAADWIVAAQPNGTYDVWLRADRDPAGSGRVYTITATASDASGNSTAKSATVLVPKSQGGGTPAPVKGKPKGKVERQ